MNRIIVIGNGFDMAHDLKTGYRDFINSYWDYVGTTIYTPYRQWLHEHWGGIPNLSDYEDEFVFFESESDKTKVDKDFFSYQKDSSFGKLYELIDEHNNCSPVTGCLRFKNAFLKRITTQCSLTNWVDIENEYYDVLKKLLLEEDVSKRSHEIGTLNNEFDAVKRLLEKYLNEVVEKSEIVKHQSIQDAFSSYIEYDEIATCKQKMFIDSIFSSMIISGDDISFQHEIDNDDEYKLSLSEDEVRSTYVTKNAIKEWFKRDNLVPSTLLLNFNYTKTAESLYTDYVFYEVINIHGELNNEKNPIIFGYGDELDDDYRKIEKLQDNDFLENIKSIEYHKTKNYRDLLRFIQLGPYQVFTMGHSCGNSDRTLLNTLFEHDNCVSIKVFYQQFEDGSDDYINLIKNISRNFNNKPLMRDIIVNREGCSPLVSVAK
ncbi:MAG: AbiH family protein [Bacteroides xylanisolvens]